MPNKSQQRNFGTRKPGPVGRRVVECIKGHVWGADIEYKRQEGPPPVTSLCVTPPACPQCRGKAVFIRPLPKASA